jgi:hypothetical protein
MNDQVAKLLREMVSIDAETGAITWRIAPARNVRVGDVVGSIDGDGYRFIRFRGCQFAYHRLVWFWAHGEWPRGQIDHINGRRDDNRLENLRDVGCSVNTQNQRQPQRRNKTGLLGVYFETKVKNRPWRSCISVDGKTVQLGGFDSPEEAHAAYVAAKRKYHAGCTL